MEFCEHSRGVLLPALISHMAVLFQAAGEGPADDILRRQGVRFRQLSGREGTGFDAAREQRIWRNRSKLLACATERRRRPPELPGSA